MHTLIARVKRGGQVFEPVLDPGDSAGEMPRRPDRDDIFRDQWHLLAEAAADLRRDDAQFGFRDPQSVGNASAQQVRHLGRRRKSYAPGRRVEGGNATARFHRHRGLPTRGERKFDHLLCSREGGSDPGGFEARVDQGVPRGHVMHQRRVGCQRLVECHDGGLSVYLDSDLFGEILGLSGRVGYHRGDRLANMVDTLMGEDRLRYRDIIRAIEARADRFDFAQRSRGYDRHLPRRVRRQNAAPCDRAAHKAQHAGTPRQIGGVAAAPSQQNRVFVARQWPPDPSHFENAWSKTSSGFWWQGEIERVVNGAWRKTEWVSSATSNPPSVHAKQPPRQIRWREGSDLPAGSTPPRVAREIPPLSPAVRSLSINHIEARGLGNLRLSGRDKTHSKPLRNSRETRR